MIEKTNSKKQQYQGAKSALAKQKRTSEKSEIQTLIRETKALAEDDSASKFTRFSELPISAKTKQGLTSSNYIKMTDIQRMSAAKSLAGSDILGAAKTGSGKTLAFVLPVIEALYRSKWTVNDGLGALIISPTRELALQIFNVLRNVGKFHSISAGLVIGGKDFEYEKDRIDRMNILVCTPGRLLQHMDETPQFDCNNLQVLVLDEADRILDLGFKKSINAIIANLPAGRQTLLFSATQTKSVSDLARLSLRDAEYIAVHENSLQSTPEKLSQNYLVCELYEKLDILFSFLRTHLTAKVLVFFSSCKQVRYVHETFCKLQPGIVLMCLHGKQKQAKRNIMFTKFCQAKAAVMFCTDIAARGLDFPAVDWVIQIDCPEDVDTYIHRVGRTARYNSNGHALTLLLPSEEAGMIESWEHKKVPIGKIAVNPSKTSSIIPQLRGLCAQNPEIKYLGEKSFICYLRSIHLQKNKKVFDVASLPIDDYASSLGLPGAPKVKFVNKLKDEKNQSRRLAKQAELEQESQKPLSESDSDADVLPGRPQVRTKADKLFSKKNQNILSSHYEKIKSRDSDTDECDAESTSKEVAKMPLVNPFEDDAEEDFLTVARKNHDLDGVPTTAPGFLDRPLSVRDKRNAKSLKRKITKEGASTTRMVYDEDGMPHLAWKLETEQEFAADDDCILAKHQKFLKVTEEVMKSADAEDKVLQKEKLREKRAVRKAKNEPKKEAAAPSLLDNDDESSFSDDQDDDQHSDFDDNIEAQEELALKLLNGDNL